ncbi:MAG: MerR family transcriptional regulator [Phycisphaerae bacterium]|nr:MerR family transcriptional regulator [Phycisphaerales bacterium]
MALLEGLDTAAVAERVGVTVRQLGHWDRLGIVSPSLVPARGSGTRRMYAEGDLVYVLLVQAVRRLGGTLDLADAVVSALRLFERDGGGMTGVRLVADADAVAYCGSDAAKSQAAIEQGVGMMVFNLDAITAKARKLAHRPSRPSVEVLELAGTAIQVVVVPAADVFTATAKKFPGLSASGRSMSAAIDALRTAIESGPADDDLEERAVEVRVTQSGASAWGGEW